MADYGIYKYLKMQILPCDKMQSNDIVFAISERNLKNAARTLHILRSKNYIGNHRLPVEALKRYADAPTLKELRRAELILPGEKSAAISLNPKKIKEVDALVNFGQWQSRDPAFHLADFNLPIRTLRAPKPLSVEEIKDIVTGSNTIPELRKMLNVDTEIEAIRTAGIYEYIGIVPIGNLERLVDRTYPTYPPFPTLYQS